MDLRLTIPVWVLLAFSIWTLLVLGATIGVYRWGRILTGRAKFATYGEYRIEGRDWYKRAMRAHANCLENLPIYAGIVVALLVVGSEGAVFDVLALVVMTARIGQTFVHVTFEQTNLVVGFRSMFYNTQWLCMMAMGALVFVDAAAT